MSCDLFPSPAISVALMGKVNQLNFRGLLANYSSWAPSNLWGGAPLRFMIGFMLVDGMV